MKKIILLVVAAACLLYPLLAGAEPGSGKTEEKPLLRAAIFVQNRAGDKMQDQAAVLNDQLTARLTEKGFSVIDKSYVMAKFKESRGADDALNQKMKTLEQAMTLKKSETSVEDAVTGASALRIAQMIGADYLVVASIDSLSKETRAFNGEGTIYGSGNRSTVFNMRIALKVLEANRGGSVYADTVTVSERRVAGEHLEVASTDLLPKLMEAGARKVADRLAGKLERIRNAQLKPVPAVEFTVNSNVEGAVVELDGAVIGSTPGRFTAAPGLHQLRISKEWLATWERTVNVNQGQLLNVTLELSAEGGRRYAGIEKLKAELALKKQQNDMAVKEEDAGIGTAKEQSGAEADAKEGIAEGGETRRGERSEREQGGAPAATEIVNPPVVADPAGAANPAAIPRAAANPTAAIAPAAAEPTAVTSPVGNQ